MEIMKKTIETLYQAGAAGQLLKAQQRREILDPERACTLSERQ